MIEEKEKKKLFCSCWEPSRATSAPKRTKMEIDSNEIWIPSLGYCK